jgi:hypothetical protein
MLVDILLGAKLWGMLSDVLSANELDIARGGRTVMLILTVLFRHTLREMGRLYMDLLLVLLSVTLY